MAPWWYIVSPFDTVLVRTRRLIVPVVFVVVSVGVGFYVRHLYCSAALCRHLVVILDMMGGGHVVDIGITWYRSGVAHLAPDECARTFGCQ